MDRYISLIMIPISITLHQMRYTTMHGGNKYYFLIKLLFHPRPRMLLLSLKSQTRRTRTSLSTTASQKNTRPASVARSALLCYYMLHIYTNISIVPRIEKSFIIGCQEMDALGQEISKEEVRQTTIPAKTWKINRLLNSSFYFLSSWQML